MERRLAGAVMLVVGLLLVPGVAHSQAQNDSVADTVLGRLELMEKAGSTGWTIRLAGKPIFETSEYAFVSIHSALSGLPKADRILIRLSTGGTACPGVFRLVDLADGGVMTRLSGLLGQAKQLSDQFGSCDDAPVTLHEATRILFDFRADGGIERWSYTLANRKLEEGALIPWDQYNPIKLKRIVEAGAKALPSVSKALTQFEGFSSRANNYLDKIAEVENRAGNLSGSVPIGHLLSLAISAGRVEAVSSIHLRNDPEVRGFSARIVKPTAEFHRVPVTIYLLFREKGQRLFPAFIAGENGRFAPLHTPEDMARTATFLWELAGADEL